MGALFFVGYFILGIIGFTLFVISVLIIRSNKRTGIILLITGLIFAFPIISFMVNIVDDKIKETNNSKLVQAIKEKNHEELELLIKKGYDVNEVRYSYNPTALVCAIKKRDSMSVKILVENKADVNQQTTKGLPLKIAIEFMDTTIIACLLKHGAVTKEMSPIQYAVNGWNSGKEVRVLEVLLKYGANVNDTSGCYTPLQRAIDQDNYKMVKLLLEYGADPNFNGKNGDYPLDMAIRHAEWYNRDKTVNPLLEHGANPTPTNSKEKIDEWIQKQKN